MCVKEKKRKKRASGKKRTGDRNENQGGGGTKGKMGVFFLSVSVCMTVNNGCDIKIECTSSSGATKGKDDPFQNCEGPRGR